MDKQNFSYSYTNQQQSKRQAYSSQAAANPIARIPIAIIDVPAQPPQTQQNRNQIPDRLSIASASQYEQRTSQTPPSSLALRYSNQSDIRSSQNSNNNSNSNSNRTNQSDNNDNSNQYQMYRDIFDEMTSDLVDLIDEVQNQFGANRTAEQSNADEEDDDHRFEQHLNELTQQNDLLQEAIELLQLKNAQSDDRLRRALDSKEEQYKQKIKSLELEAEQNATKFNTLNRKHQALLYDVKQYKDKCKCGAVEAVEIDKADKDVATMLTGTPTGRKGQDLTHIFEMMERKDDELKVLKEYSTNEKIRLNKRIADTDEQIKEYEVQIARLKTDLTKKDHELKDLRKQFAQMSDDTKFTDVIDKLEIELAEERSQRKERETTLEAKVKGLETALEETRITLVKEKDSLATLEAQTANYSKQNETALKENKILRDELFILKGNIATLEGTERSLKSQLSKTQNEVQTLCTANVKIKTLTEDLDNYKDNCVRLNNRNFELIAKYNNLIEDYNVLADELRKVSELKDCIEKESDVFRKWQRDQIDQDKKMKEYIKHLTDHIETLSKDRDELIQKLYDYHQDLLIVSSELDHYKEIFADTLGEAQDRASLAAGEIPGRETADAIIRKVLRTAEKLAHTRKTFRESLDRRNSK